MHEAGLRSCSNLQYLGCWWLPAKVQYGLWWTKLCQQQLHMRPDLFRAILLRHFTMDDMFFELLSKILQQFYLHTSLLQSMPVDLGVILGYELHNFKSMQYGQILG